MVRGGPAAARGERPPVATVACLTRRYAVRETRDQPTGRPGMLRPWRTRPSLCSPTSTASPRIGGRARRAGCPRRRPDRGHRRHRGRPAAGRGARPADRARRPGDPGAGQRRPGDGGVPADRSPRDPGRDRGLAARRLRPEQVALLGGLPESVTLEVGDLAPVLFCHATPRNDEEAVPRRLPPGPVGGGARRPGSRGRHGRPRSHAHAVRPVGPWAARGQPRRRRHAVRPPGCPLGAARLRG